MKDCNSCGKCCIKYSDGQLSATQVEIETWEASRPDIHRYVKDGKIWVDPNSGEPIKLCPWLRQQPNQSHNQTRYTCDIYFDRPEDCRYYPSTLEEMIRDECEMIEPRDLRNPKQAQRELQIIISER